MIIRLSIFGNFIALFAALFCVIKKDEISGGIAGLSISYAMQVSTILISKQRQGNKTRNRAL